MCIVCVCLRFSYADGYQKAKYTRRNKMSVHPRFTAISND